MTETEARVWPRPFTSALTKREAILVLVYLPVHLFVLLRLFSELALRGALSDGMATLLFYAVGFAYMLTAGFGFLRREYDALADRPFRSIGEVLSSYCIMLAFNYLTALALTLLLPDAANPNNEALAQAAGQDSRPVAAAVIFLGPVVEEMLFRAGIFGVLRRRNRAAAYAVSMVCFSFYHVAPYAAAEPLYWFYLVQYMPASYLLTRCYERSNSIWCSIFFHMFVNGVAMSTLRLLG